MTVPQSDFQQRLDDISNVVWDEALPYMFDVEHTIHSHADSLPDMYRKLAAAVEKIRQLSNYRPDPEEST